MGTHPIFESDFDCLTDSKMWRTTSLARRRSVRYQPNVNTMGPQGYTKRTANVDPDYQEWHDPGNTVPGTVNPSHVKYDEFVRLNAEHRAFTQGRGTHADYWPQVHNSKWIHLTTPLVPNVKPLPGREQDNQRRWVGQCNTLLPWFEPYLEKRMSEWERKNEVPSNSRLAAISKLLSVAYMPRKQYRETLLKIMTRPLMRHEFDFKNDAVRCAALTIDIREHQQHLVYHEGLAERGVSRALVMLQKQRTRVLNRLREQDLELYCKTLDRLNIEHFGLPVLNRVCRVEFTERIISMKLRTMRQIEINIEKERIESERLNRLCDQGEALYAQTKGDMLSFKDASALAKQIAARQERVIEFVADLKQTVTKSHKLRSTLNVALVAFDRTRATFERDGVTRQEQAQQLIEQFEAITQTLESVRARAELIEEIETKFDEIIENTRQLQRMTRPKSVLRKLLHQATNVNLTDKKATDEEGDDDVMYDKAAEFLRKFEIFEEAKEQLDRDFEAISASEAHNEEINRLLNQSLTLLSVCQDLIEHEFDQ